MPTLKVLLKDMRKSRPAKERPKRPTTLVILKKWLSVLDLNKPYHRTMRCIMIIAYLHLLRTGEYTYTKDMVPFDNMESLNWYDITVGYDKDIPKVLRVRVKRPKSYAKKTKCEFTLSKCRCKDLGICALHEYIKYFNYIKPKDTTRPAFMENDVVITDTKMTNFINWLCMKTNMNKLFYTPHCFRSGYCTDLKEKGVDDYIIQRLGRWDTNCWLKHYVLLDLFDVLRLS